MANWEIDPQNKSVPLEQPAPVSRVAAPTPSPFLPAGLSSVNVLLGGAWKIYKSRFGIILGIIIFPLILILLLALSDKISQISGFSRTTLLMVLASATFILGLWSQVALIYVICKREEKISISRAFSLGWNKISSYFWISVLAALITAGGGALLIVPGIILSVWFSLSVFALVSEEYKGMNALLRSKQLVSGYWGKIFGRFLLSGFIAVILSLAVTGPISFFAGKEAANAVGDVVSFFITPFFLAYSFLIYEDLKRIKAGVSFVPPKAGTKVKYILLGIFGFIIMAAIILFVLFAAQKYSWIN